MQHNTRTLKWSLVAAIVIVVNLFFNYSLSLIYKSPEYQNFCKNEQVVEAITTKDQCLLVGGQWNESAVPSEPGSKAYPAPSKVVYCDASYTCNKDYMAAQEIYDRNVFVTLVALGVLMMLLGFAFRSNDVLSYGFSLGGVLSFIVASFRYWGSADDLIKVGILAVALAALIYLAYKKFSNTVPSSSHDETLRP